MIHLDKKSIHEGFCSFCNQGEMIDKSMKYPYDYTYHLSGESGQIMVRICPDCIKHLKLNLILMPNDKL